MVNVEALRRKFKPKKGPAARAGGKSGKPSKAAIKEAIRREFAEKKANLTGGAPEFKRGFVFYSVIIIGLLILGSLVLSVTGRGGRPEISKAQIQARKSMDALAVALGRYRFHVGDYPSTAEGLEALAAITPKKKGWFGPYTTKIVPDPWGKPYVYETREEGGHPVLYSCGPDRRMGTTDDVMPDQNLFDEPFRDTTWTNHWVPYQLRGIVVAPDAATKRKIEEEVKKY